VSLTVLIDARNVLRSRWPNIPEGQLVDLVREWAGEEGFEAEIVFDGRAPRGGIGTGPESADDWITRRAASAQACLPPFSLAIARKVEAPGWLEAFVPDLEDAAVPLRRS
jgi:hypothetical protein